MSPDQLDPEFPKLTQLSGKAAMEKPMKEDTERQKETGKTYPHSSIYTHSHLFILGLILTCRLTHWHANIHSHSFTLAYSFSHTLMLTFSYIYTFIHTFTHTLTHAHLHIHTHPDI